MRISAGFNVHPISFSSCCFFFTFLQGSDGTHVVSTQEKEGVCVWGQPNQPLGRILEHQILGGGVGVRGEEVEVLKTHY